jgi:hypothetical protein
MYRRRDGCARYAPRPIAQIDELALEIGLVILPSHPVHSRRCISLESEKRQPEQIDVDVVEERGEPLLLP